MATAELKHASSCESHSESLNDEQFAHIFIEESKKHSVTFGAIKAL